MEPKDREPAQPQGCPRSFPFLSPPLSVPYLILITLFPLSPPPISDTLLGGNEFISLFLWK